MKQLLVFLLLANALYLAAQEKPSANSYAVNFDRSTLRTRTDRQLTALKLGGNSVQVENEQLMYHDLTQQLLTVRPGETVTPVFGFSGNWMQGYVYIDLNRNGAFDVQQPGSHGALGDDNELVAFAGMTLEDGLYNSDGEELANLSAVQPPQFTIPADLEEGYYMMRWKIDWDDCDPAGRVDEKNSIIQNGGAIADVLLHVTTHPEEGMYQLVFADEFNLPNGSAPDQDMWRVCERSQSVWNRWISDSPEVAFIQDGHLVCRAIPNAGSEDEVPMLTGAIETRNNFSFTYGNVEVRLQTAPFAGNFPAAWMMPQPPCEIWPNAGEIDIFEAIDAQKTSYHTIHSHWSFDLGHKTDPISSFTKNVDVSLWHTYGLEWLEDRLIFTVDGTAIATYWRSEDEEVLQQGQWPFKHPFYLILNQSVGDGSWAKAADITHTYETRFDYVRVYQRAASDGIHEVSGSHIASDNYYDLSGRRIAGSPHRRGIYIHRGRKMIIK